MLIFANVIQTFFSPLIVAFESILVFLHGHVLAGSWGFAIVGLTVIVRAVMLPIAIRQLRSAHKIQTLAPRLKEIKEQYKDDAVRQRQESMRLYRENGVKPLGAFMPLIAQAPVFVSLYYALRENLKLDICGEQLKHYFHVTSPSKIPSGKLQSVGCNQVARHSARFLFLGDITAPSAGLTLVVMMALYVSSQIAAMLLGSAGAAPGSKAVMLAMPFVLLLFIYSFPPGVIVYWITTNFWSAGQGYLIRRSIAAPLAAPALVGGSEATIGDPAVEMATTSSSARPVRRKKKRSGRRR